MKILIDSDNFELFFECCWFRIKKFQERKIYKQLFFKKPSPNSISLLNRFDMEVGLEPTPVARRRSSTNWFYSIYKQLYHHLCTVYWILNKYVHYQFLASSYHYFLVYFKFIHSWVVHKRKFGRTATYFIFNLRNQLYKILIFMYKYLIFLKLFIKYYLHYICWHYQYNVLYWCIQCTLVCVLAVLAGLEPVTPCVTGMYSNQLNYSTILLQERDLNPQPPVWLVVQELNLLVEFLIST